MIPTHTSPSHRVAPSLTVEDAEGLREALATVPAAALDLHDVVHLHTAALQVLMAARRPVSRWPADPTLARWLRAALFPAAALDSPRMEAHA